MRKISLKALEAACQHYLMENSGRLPDEIRYLGGLQRIQYVFVYPEQNDIVLAGPAEGWKVDEDGNVIGETTGRPVLQLDDLARRAAHRQQRSGRWHQLLDQPDGKGMRALNSLLQQQRVTGHRANCPGPGTGHETGLWDHTDFARGVPANSHLARVLVAADYRMKTAGNEAGPIPDAGLPELRRNAQRATRRK